VVKTLFTDIAPASPIARVVTPGACRPPPLGRRRRDGDPELTELRPVVTKAEPEGQGREEGTACEERTAREERMGREREEGKARGARAKAG
jgi:hypothetical protein